MKYIELTQNKKAIIDDEDYILVDQYNWYCNNSGYARTNICAGGKQCQILMHRLILNAPVGVQVDHINLDKLDNRKCNLRLCNNAQNQYNTNKKPCNISGYKGVAYVKENGKWMARIMVNGKIIYLGIFTDVIDAAREYNKAAIKYFGEFAKLNMLP